MDFSPQQAKLQRAKTKERELKASIENWLSDRPWDCKAVVSKSRREWKLFLVVNEKPPIDDWELTFNETTHLLRSLLDNLVMTITRSPESDTPKNLKLVKFPICGSPKEWADSRSGISHLPEKYRARIEAVQPFNREEPTKDALLLLRDLDNENKHYLQVKASLLPREMTHTVAVEYENEADAAKNIPPKVEAFEPALVDGELLLSQKTESRIASVQGKWEVGGIITVRINDENYPVAILSGLCDYIGTVFSYVVDGTVQ